MPCRGRAQHGSTILATAVCYLLCLLCAVWAGETPRVALVQYSDPEYFDATEDTYSGEKGQFATSQSFTAVAAWAYAKRHNYTYIQARDHQVMDADRYWVKPNALHAVMQLKKFDIIVLMDADVLFMQPQIPLHDLLKRWGFGDKPGHIIAAALDPIQWNGYQSVYGYKGPRRLLVNTGFMIWKTTERAQLMAEKWATCIVKKHPVCLEFARMWAHEMSAFNRMIRVDELNEDEELVLIPCTEALGYDGALLQVEDNNCKGTYVSHNSAAKHNFHKVYHKLLHQQLMEVALRDIHDHSVMHINE
jgi:hypothetical protein